MRASSFALRTAPLLLALVGFAAAAAPERAAQPAIEARAKPVITVDGLRFRDLNGNGRLDPYEDWRLPAEARAADLVKQMTLEEKAGMMVHGTAPAGQLGQGDRYDAKAAQALVTKGVGAFITRLAGDPAVLAEENNSLQLMAEKTRLGVPLIISTDPRNGFDATTGASNKAGGFSTWPDAPGMAAIGDPAVTRRFGDIARQEYRAVGIQEALSPQADLATEPRWPRINGTFGEDPALARRMTQAYVQGFQGGETGLAPSGVITVVKHWVGYGAVKDGWDSHNFYGRYAAFGAGALEQHIEPFRGAFAAGAAGIMPTYAILQGVTLDGKPLEQVGAGFNAQLLTHLLRDKEGFRGFVLSDWAITNDCPEACRDGQKPGGPLSIAMPWGVETLSREDRFAKAINAGVDQVGGTEESEQIVAAAKAGKISAARIDQAVMRVLVPRFQLGLFEAPYVDPKAAAGVVGNAAFREEAAKAQRRSLVLLQNRGVLPLRPGTKVYLKDVSAEVAAAHGLVVVSEPSQAQAAIVRTGTPHQLLHPAYFFGSRQHEGDLDFKPDDPEYKAITAIASVTPTVAAIYLDRPAILTNLKDKAAALVGTFGVGDDALIEVLMGGDDVQGRLPFELPSSMDEVRAQSPDKPHDTAHPLYPFGFGLRFPRG